MTVLPRCRELSGKGGRPGASLWFCQTLGSLPRVPAFPPPPFVPPSVKKTAWHKTTVHTQKTRTVFHAHVSSHSRRSATSRRTHALAPAVSSPPAVSATPSSARLTPAGMAPAAPAT